MCENLRGQFLLAGKSLRDPNFFRSVVLMVDHGSEGAMGLIVNRPSAVTVSHALSEHFSLPDSDDLVYFGGPVEPSALFILHDRSEFQGEESPILPGLFVGNSPEIFEAVVRSRDEGDEAMQFRIFCGCAGWAAGQLEGEIDRGDWFHLEANCEALFSEDPYDVWDTLRCRIHKSPLLLPESPGDPEWN